jgi:hypothetical protein
MFFYQRVKFSFLRRKIGSLDFNEEIIADYIYVAPQAERTSPSTMSEDSFRPVCQSIVLMPTLHHIPLFLFWTLIEPSVISVYFRI